MDIDIATGEENIILEGDPKTFREVKSWINDIEIIKYEVVMVPSEYAKENKDLLKILKDSDIYKAYAYKYIMCGWSEI